ncbi:response regulator [Aeromicrobium ginsengisoli]|nr:response regulator transcription factor [Aeromicrobium ginsengisoli]
MVALRVMLVDDATVIREGLARLLRDEGLDVVAQHADALGIVSAVEQSRPDVVILDVRMPPSHTTEGLVAAVELKASHSDVGVLVLSQYVETHHAIDLLRGAHSGFGYLLKERISAHSDLVDAITRIADGGIVIDPEVVRRVLDTPRHADPLDRLTAREREVLALVAEGHSNASIADLLATSGRTIETHTSRIFTKLDLEVTTATHRRVLAVLAHLRASTS